MRHVSEDHWLPPTPTGYDTWRPMYAACITVPPIDGKGVACEQWLLGDDRCKARSFRHPAASSCLLWPCMWSDVTQKPRVVVTQSAVALAQGSVLTHDAARLAEAMNRLAGAQGWLGAFVDVFAHPRQTFTALMAPGPFATILYAFGMPMSHMVVVDGLDSAGRVVLRDPARGTRYLMLWDEFTRVWEGQTVLRVMP